MCKRSDVPNIEQEPLNSEKVRKVSGCLVGRERAPSINNNKAPKQRNMARLATTRSNQSSAE